jgi:hypothetical protein
MNHLVDRSLAVQRKNAVSEKLAKCGVGISSPAREILLEELTRAALSTGGRAESKFLSLRTLQDYCLAQEPAFIGLLSMFTGSTLQDDIQDFARRLIEQGCNILGRVLPEQRNEKLSSDYDHQTSPATQSAASDPQQF